MHIYFIDVKCEYWMLRVEIKKKKRRAVQGGKANNIKRKVLCISPQKIGFCAVIASYTRFAYFYVSTFQNNNKEEKKVFDDVPVSVAMLDLNIDVNQERPGPPIGEPPGI